MTNNAGATLTTTTGTINGGLVNRGTTDASGTVDDAILNQGAGIFTVTGALAGGATSFNVNGLGYGRSDLFQAGAFVRRNVTESYAGKGVVRFTW